MTKKLASWRLSVFDIFEVPWCVISSSFEVDGCHALPVSTCQPRANIFILSCECTDNSGRAAHICVPKIFMLYLKFSNLLKNEMFGLRGPRYSSSMVSEDGRQIFVMFLPAVVIRNTEATSGKRQTWTCRTDFKWQHVACNQGQVRPIISSRWHRLTHWPLEDLNEILAKLYSS